MGKSLIVDHYWATAEVLEAKGDGLPTRIKAIVQQVDHKNRNSRIYPARVIERELSKFNQNPSRRPGLVDHPIEDFSSVSDIGIHWERAWIESDGYVWGEGRLVETQKGRDLQAAIASGVEIGFSSRGYATSTRTVIDGEPTYIINDDYELETFDAVVDPGVAEARIKYAEGVANRMNKELETRELEQATAVEEAIAEAETAMTEAAETCEKPDNCEKSDCDCGKAEESEDTSEKETVAESGESLTLEDQAQLLTEQSARIDELTTKLQEAELAAATLRTHAENLSAALSALVQTMHDSLDREDFYTTRVFADLADFMNYIRRDLEWSADYQDETVENVVSATAKLFQAFEKHLIKSTIIERCKDERFGMLLVKRVAEKAESLDGIDALIESERESIERAIAERRGIPAPKGNVDPPKVKQESHEFAEYTRIIKEMAVR